MQSWVSQGPAGKICSGLAQLAFLAIFSGANFFASLYVHRRSRETQLHFYEKSESNLVLSVDAISKFKADLEEKCKDCRQRRTRAVINSFPDSEIIKYDKDIEYTIREISNLDHVLSLLHDGIQPDELAAAVEIVVRRAAANLNTATYIDNQALTLSITRDVNAIRVPVSQSTVENALQQYKNSDDGHGAKEVDLI